MLSDYSNLIKAYSEVLNGNINAVNEISNPLILTLFDLTLYKNYNQFINNLNLNNEEVTRIEFEKILEKADKEISFIAEIIVDINDEVVQALILPDILHPLYEGKDYDVRWGRVFFEKIYFDLFHHQI